MADPPLASGDIRATADGTSDPNANIRYVLAGQPTGWAAVAASVREYDEDRIKSTKEDIDTLLVFVRGETSSLICMTYLPPQAGLFSAVLTAFLIESYQRLLPDTAAQTSSQMLSVLQQISLQIANSTYPPFVLPSPDATSQAFQPSATDIRVNVLWFASLIFSLITASLGILVKQWLREYLAIDNRSPVARLRIRYYRHPKLKNWKVLEIAAALPLLQQLALALFFIGLCYFTASIHGSVGYTSLPLVAAWAFFFSTVTILPIFFPGCPYKTALLKPVLEFGFIGMTKQLIKWCLRGRCNWDADAGKTRKSLWHVYRDMRQARAAHDESRVARRGTVDLDILADADSLQADDELLCTAILGTVGKSTWHTWDDIVDFVVRVIEHRSWKAPIVFSTKVYAYRLLGSSLSLAVYRGVVDIISRHSEMEITRSTISQWLQRKATPRALHVLLGPGAHPFPQSGIILLSKILQQESRPLFCTLIEQCTEPTLPLRSGYFAELLRLFQLRAEDLNCDLASSMQYLESFIHLVFEDAHKGFGVQLPPGRFTLHGNVRAWPWVEVDRATDSPLDHWRISAEVVRSISKTVSRIARGRPRTTGFKAGPLGTQADSSMTVASRDGLHDALDSMWKMFLVCTQTLQDEESWGPDPPGSVCSIAVCDCLSQEESAISLLMSLNRIQESFVTMIYPVLASYISSDLHKPGWILGTCVYAICIRAYGDSINAIGRLGPKRKSYLQNFTNAVDALHTSCSISATHALRILCLGVRMMDLERYDDDPQGATPPWNTLFHAVSRLLHTALIASPSSVSSLGSTASTSYSSIALPCEDVQLAEVCLEHVQKSDMKILTTNESEGECTYDRWLRLSEKQTTVFGDDLVALLGTIAGPHIPPDKLRNFFRLRKLGVAQDL